MIGLIWFYIILGWIFLIAAKKCDSIGGYALAISCFAWAIILNIFCR